MAQQVQPERHWLWSADAEDGYGFERAFSEAKFWACGVYSRACDRLRTAAAGHNASSIHNPPCINTDCLQIVACCPFYGCFIGKLQQRVRLFYGIDGCDWDDFWDACCCPCLTLVRSEQEIILRERLANDPNGCNKAYQRHGPMVSTYTSPNVCCQCDNGCLPFCCRGNDPECSGAGPRMQGTAPAKIEKRPPVKPATAPVISHPRQAPGHINLRNLHGRDDHPTIAEKHATAHRVEGDHHALGKAKFGDHIRHHDQGRGTPHSDVSHRLEDDPIITRCVGTPKHDLREDPLTPTHHGPASPHSMHTDPLVKARQNHGAQHSLESDHMAATRAGVGHLNAHAIVDDDTHATVRGPGGQVHHLNEHAQVKGAAGF